MTSTRMITRTITIIIRELISLIQDGCNITFDVVIGDLLGSFEMVNTLAWILATNADSMIRNGKEAVLYAEMACKDTGYKEAAILDTLAVAYAEAGRFQEAVITAQKAIEKAEKSQDKSVVEEMKKRLQLYQSGKAYHENK